MTASSCSTAVSLCSRRGVEGADDKGGEQMRQFARLSVLALAAVLVMAVGAIGQGAYPTKPITLVTHSSVGAGGDIFLRNLAKYLEGIVNVPIVVEDRSGGASTRAVPYVATTPNAGAILS